MRLISQTKPTRQAFTLVELIVVIAIILTLAALLLSAVFKAINVADELKNTTDIRQLDVAVQAFLTKYQMPYMPSRIRLCTTNSSPGVDKYDTSLNANGTPNTPLDFDSLQYLQRVWPRISISASTPMSWDGVTSGPASFVLTGQECLVFFLAGIVDRGRGNFQGRGFSIDATSPAGHAITSATNASPIVITSNGHKLTSGAQITIFNVGGNYAANGTFNITVVDPNNFSLNGSAGNGPYTLGGVWSTAWNQPFYDFKAERLVGGPSGAFFQYLDAYGAANDSKSQPFLYFSSYKTANNYNRYGPTDCSMTLNGALTSGSGIVTGLWSTNGLVVGQPVTGSGIPIGTTIASVNSPSQITLSQGATGSGPSSLNFGIFPYVIGSNFLNPSSFQIISAGKNKLFGAGGTWAAATASDTYPPGSGGADDQANFYTRPLGIPTP